MVDEQTALRRKAHHVPVPKWFRWVRIAQLVIAIMCAGLAAYVSRNLPWFETSDLMIFVGFATAIFVVYVLLATTAVPVIYNFWIILLLEILTLIFWVCAFLALAFEIAIVAAATDLISDAEKDATAKYLGHEFSIDLFHHTKMAGDAACIFGAIIFIMFFVTLVSFSSRLRRFRKSGGKALPSSNRSVPPVNAPGGMGLQMETGLNAEPVVIQMPKNDVVYSTTPVSEFQVRN